MAAAARSRSGTHRRHGRGAVGRRRRNDRPVAGRSNPGHGDCRSPVPAAAPGTDWRTRRRTRPGSAWTSIRISPPSASWAMPCSTAFSTSGCSTSRGRPQAAAARRRRSPSGPAAAARGAALRSPGSARPGGSPRPGVDSPWPAPSAARNSSDRSSTARSAVGGSLRTRLAMVFIELNRKCGRIRACKASTSALAWARRRELHCSLT